MDDAISMGFRESITIQ